MGLKIDYMAQHFKRHIWRYFYGIIKIMSQKMRHHNGVTKIFQF